MLDAGERIAFGQFGQIEAGAEMLARRRQSTDGADALRHRGEERLDARDRRVVERVALLRRVKRQHRDRAVPFGPQRRRQIGKFGCVASVCHSRGGAI